MMIISSFVCGNDSPIIFYAPKRKRIGIKSEILKKSFIKAEILDEKMDSQRHCLTSVVQNTSLKVRTSPSVISKLKNSFILEFHFEEKVSHLIFDDIDARFIRRTRSHLYHLNVSFCRPPIMLGQTRADDDGRH
jgi:hypothetical protein